MSNWGLPMLLLLLVLDLAIGATRVSLLNARPVRLQNKPGLQPGKVARTQALIENPRLRANLRLSQTVMRFMLAILTYQSVRDLVTDVRTLPIWEFLSLLLLAMLMLVVEFELEQRVLRDPDVWALRLVDFGRALLIVFGPLTFLPLLVLKPTYGQHPSHAQFTEDELKNWAESDEEPGSLEREERQMIYSIFQFRDTLTREIMVPRIDILALDVKTSLADAIQAFQTSGHSRLPIYEATIDNLVGLLYAKDLLKISSRQADQVSLRDLLRPAYFVPETKKVDELLAEMQSQRIHMGIVVDEYGGVAGLVTLEDIVEEIVGEIRDEYDPASEEVLYQEVGQQEYMFQGRIDLDDFNEVMDSHLSKDEADTLAGFLYDQMGRVPQGGESIEVDGLSFMVEQVSGRRIRRVRVHRVPLSEEKQGNDQINR
jgi:putative hemolysin